MKFRLKKSDFIAIVLALAVIIFPRCCPPLRTTTRPFLLIRSIEFSSLRRIAWPATFRAGSARSRSGTRSARTASAATGLAVRNTPTD